MKTHDIIEKLNYQIEAFKKIRTVNETTLNENRFFNLSEIVSHYGRVFNNHIDLPEDFVLGEPGNCFGNAFRTMIRLWDLHNEPEWCYVEGFASTRLIDLLIPHAWLSNRNGDVLELTWIHKPGDITYYGIPFDFNYVMRATTKSGYYGVLTPGELYNDELFSKKVGPETFLHHWFKEEILSRYK